MRLILESLDGLSAAKDCTDVDEEATCCMSPLWRGKPTAAGNPLRFQEWRKYKRTDEIRDGLPVFREE